jgi:lysozyme
LKTISGEDISAEMERNLLEKFSQTPEAKRLLDTISFAEGTYRDNPEESYRVMFGGGLFNDLSRHPDKVIHGGRYSSAAAGRYQFMPGTWENTSGRLGLQTFGPKEQDLAALKLARDRLMPIGGLSVLQKEGFTPRVSNLLAPEWASFPTSEGVSYYGQPVRSFSELEKFYQNVKAPGSAPSETPSQVVEPQTKEDTKPKEQRGMQFLRNYLHFLPGFGSSMVPEATSSIDAPKMLAQAFKPPQFME